MSEVMRKPINLANGNMHFVMFTLALVLNYHVHLISVADELVDKIGDGTLHVPNLKMKNRFQDGQMHILLYPEDSVRPACQHG